MDPFHEEAANRFEQDLLMAMNGIRPQHVLRRIARYKKYMCFVLFGSVGILSTSEPCGFFPLGDAVCFVVLGAVVDAFHFRAVWILSTRRLSVVRCVLRCC